MFPKVNCAIYSAQLVYVCVCVHTIVCVCEPHLLQKYGCIEFEDGSSTGSSPGAKFGENPKKESNRYLPKLAMLFGVAPSAKNSDFTARLRHLPALFIYLFFAPSTFFWCIYLRHISKVLLASIWMQWGLTRLKPPEKESQQRFISRTCISDPKSARVRVNPN